MTDANVFYFSTGEHEALVDPSVCENVNGVGGLSRLDRRIYKLILHYYLYIYYGTRKVGANI